jgi:hypothetical protein
MRLTGKDIFYLTLVGAGAYVLYRVFNFGESVSEAVNKFWTGLTFDPASLGPAISMPPGAAQAQTDWIQRGYLEILPDGSTRITAAGEAYIRQQREKTVQGTVINQ